MKYLKNYIVEFSQYHYKIRHNDTNLGMFYDKLPYSINNIINEEYIPRLKKANVIDTLDTTISYLRKWANDQCLDLKKQKKMKKLCLACCDNPHPWAEKESFIRKRVLTNKGERNIGENIITSQVLKNVDFLEKQLIVRLGKTIASIRHAEK